MNSQPCDVITISKQEYKRLLAAEEKLEALEAYGVDSWDGYETAVGELKKPKDSVKDWLDRL